jgi:hypothetical protein
VGSFGNIRLDFTPEPPEPKEYWSKVQANYSTALAYLHIFLDGQDAAAKLPSANFCPLLEGLFKAVPIIMGGGTANAKWYSDPWLFHLRGYPDRNRVAVTLHIPDHWAAMREVSVPLDMFGREVIQVGRRWLKYLDKIYHEEIVDKELGQQYRQLEGSINKAQRVL